MTTTTGFHFVIAGTAVNIGDTSESPTSIPVLFTAGTVTHATRTLAANGYADIILHKLPRRMGKKAALEHLSSMDLPRYNPDDVQVWNGKNKITI